jgi:hypothetical protein
MQPNPSIDANLVLFVGVVSVSGAFYLLGMRNIPSNVAVKSLRMRILFLAGLFVTASLLFLGGIWPSVFTLAAIVALPAPFLFVFLIIRPSFVLSWDKVRHYLAVCIILSVLSWLGELLWLAH